MAFSSILLDVVCLLIMLGCIIYYAKKGFLSAIVSLVGTIAVFIVARISSVRFSPWIFDNYFRPGLQDKAAEAISSQGTVDLESIFGWLSMFIPKETMKELMDKLALSNVVSAEKAAAAIVDKVIQPMIAPFIAAVVFVFIFVILSLLVGFLSRLLTATRKIPIIGTANSLLGAVSGGFIGFLYVLVIFIAISAAVGIWADMTAKKDLFDHSVVWNLLSRLGIKIM